MSAVLRVVELTDAGIAGPVCGRLFAAFGHCVVKAEPPTGSALRRRPPHNADGESFATVALDADKESVIVPPEETAARAVVARLLAWADVLVVELPRARAEALGVDPATIRATHPDLVVVALSATGTTGPGVSREVELPGDSLLAEAYGGLANMVGDPARRPLSLGGEQTAYSAGVAAFFGAMIALLRRDQGEGGDVVDVSLVDVAAYMDWKSDVGLALDHASPTRALSDSGSRLVRAADGWVGVIFQHRHWAAVTELVGDPALADPALQDAATWLARAGEWWPVIERWVGRLPAKDVYERAQRAGLPFGWALSVADLPTDSQIAARGFVRKLAHEQVGRVTSVAAPFASDELGWRFGRPPVLGSGSAAGAPDGVGPAQSAASAPAPASASASASDRPAPAGSRAPLAGVIVLDFGTITAGAATTRLLADHGATVLKIESLDRPDLFRWWKGSTAFFPSNNVGKLGVAIDLKTPEGRALLGRLAERSHVFVENFRVGVPARLGIDARTLRGVNPGLVYLSLSSQGQDGPQARNISYGSTLDLLSGLASLTGYTPDEPLWSSSNVNYPDQLVSLFGAALAAYCIRMGVHGATFDVSQREVVGWTLDAELTEFLATGRVPRACGNRRPGSAPHDTYPCAEPDRWFALACTDDAQRAALAGCLGVPELADRPQAWWIEHQDLVDAAIRNWARTRTRDECVAGLGVAGVPAVPVLDAAGRAADPRFVDRRVNLPQQGAKGFPFRFARYEPPLPAPAPGLGEHTRQVLRDVLGISEAELAELERSGIVHQGSGERAPA